MAAFLVLIGNWTRSRKYHGSSVPFISGYNVLFSGVEVIEVSRFCPSLQAADFSSITGFFLPPAEVNLTTPG